MEGHARSAETFSDPVPDMVKQFVVYLYRHIRYVCVDVVRGQSCADMAKCLTERSASSGVC